MINFICYASSYALFRNQDSTLVMRWRYPTPLTERTIYHFGIFGVYDDSGYYTNASIFFFFSISSLAGFALRLPVGQDRSNPVGHLAPAADGPEYKRFSLDSAAKSRFPEADGTVVFIESLSSKRNYLVSSHFTPVAVNSATGLEPTSRAVVGSRTVGIEKFFFPPIIQLTQDTKTTKPKAAGQ